MHQLLQVVAVRLQRVTMTALHKFLGLSNELVRSPETNSDASDAAGPALPFDVKSSGDLTLAVAKHVAEALKIEVGFIILVFVV
jgi:hypothetical protein